MQRSYVYIFVMAKFPEPAHPPVPVRVHVPEIVLSLTVPLRTSVLPEGVPDSTVNWKVPVTFPFTFPLRTNDPVSDPPEVKQEVEVVNTRFVPVTSVPLPCVNEVVRAKAWVPSVSVNVAVQLPDTLPELEPPPPHPPSTNPNASSVAMTVYFVCMTAPYNIPNPKGFPKSRLIDAKLPVLPLHNGSSHLKSNENTANS